MPVTLAADAEVRDGIALVTATVRNPTPVARRVEVANRLDGPVLPPRRDGVPEAGWDDDGPTVVVDADATVPFGYACPVADGGVVDPPAELVDVGALESDRPGTAPVDRARRDLGEFRPPRDAVPFPYPDAPPDDGGGTGTGTSDAHPDSETDEADGEGHDATTGEVAANPDPDDVNGPLPPDVAAYLERVGRRVKRAERLTDASVPEATAALGACDRHPANLAAAVAADADALDLLAERAADLADRAQGTDVPVDALARLA